MALGGPPWKGPQLAQVIGQHDDDSILEAMSLLVSQRPALQGALIEVLQMPPGQRFRGTIKSFKPEKHFGFIDCEELKAEFGGDVFLSDQEIGSFTVGSAVTFSITLNKDGRPQAKLLEQAAAAQWTPEPPSKRPRMDPQWSQPQHAQWAPPQRIQLGRVAPAAPAQWGQHVQQPRQARAPAGDPMQQRHIGTISKFFPDKHFGFIHSEELQRVFGADVFLSDKEIGSFGIGSEVTFFVELNKSGKPQARALEDAAFASAGHGNGTDGRYIGVVKSFNAEKHFGFIQCDAIQDTQGCDVFLSDKEIASFEVGSTVSFSVTYNKNGKPQAHELQPAA